jgi:hypothetical protein
MTVQYAVVRLLTNGSDQAVASVELTTPNKTAAVAKYHEILADAAIKAGSGRLADGAFILANNGGVQEQTMFVAPEEVEE